MIIYQTLLQKFLRAGGTIEQLKEKYAISSSTHGKYPHLISFKYNQIDSPFGEEIVREARSLVLDSSDNWRLLCQGFKKFFNYGEGHAAEIDWQNAKMQEKVDGTLICVYEYNGEWQTSTTGTPDAGGNVGDFNMSFSQLFWNTVDHIPEIDDMTRNLCFFFELCGPLNKIVVNHKKTFLTALGGRNRLFGNEFAPETTAAIWQVPAVLEFPLVSFLDATKMFESIDPLNQEGFVYKSVNKTSGVTERVKHKHPGYVALHHLKSSFSLKNLLEIVREGTMSNFSEQLPEYKDVYDDVVAKYNLLTRDIESAFDSIKHIESQKEFASFATKYKFSGVLFSLRSKKVESIQEALQKMNIQNLMNWLGLKYEEKEQNEEV